MQVGDAGIIDQLLKGNMVVYEKVYKTFCRPLQSYAYTILKDEIVAEEIVQSLFVKLWEKKETISIQSSLKAYLYKSVYNLSLNSIKHDKVKQQYGTHIIHTMKHVESETPVHTTVFKNLESKFRQALNELPEQCRTVFQMSRFEQLKYREIAEELKISEKTVEQHMGKALKLLRTQLVDFLVIIFLFIRLINYLF